ncbi:MAG: GxxExxY protein [Blastocatellia bacterium]
MSELIYKEESYLINGACFNVYNQMGCGFLEPVYQECLAIEFEHQKIPFVREPELTLHYRGRQLSQKYRPDFICYGKIIVELKAVSKIVDEHRAQVLNYLSATGYELAILYNFGHHPKVEYERFANTTRQSGG